MLGQPFDWNVVVVGAWNVAILTPGGVAKRLFRLPPGTPVEVQVPLDAPHAPMQVKRGGMVVAVAPSGMQLTVGPEQSAFSGLQEAAEIAARAIEDLPETPVRAAGVNIRYRFDSIPDQLQSAIGAPIDNLLQGHLRAFLITALFLSLLRSFLAARADRPLRQS